MLHLSDSSIYQFFNGTYVTDEHTANFVRTLGAFTDELGVWTHARNDVMVRSMIEYLYEIFKEQDIDKEYHKRFEPKPLTYVFGIEDRHRYFEALYA